MTKYILNSGGIKKYPDKLKKINQELVKDLSESPKVLICIFAEKREDWEEKYENNKQIMLENMPESISPSFELAMPNKFVEQVKNSEAIIILGGDDHLLRYWLDQFDIPKIWDGKTVSVMSASSDAMATNYWTCDWRQTGDGLGILPIKFIPHYKSDYGVDDPRGPIDWDKAYKELENYGDKSLPIYALEEGDFIVINK